VRLLLDTHAVIWFLAGSSALSTAAKRAIAAPENDVFISAVSGYEIVGKARLGRLDPVVAGEFARFVRSAAMATLPITLAHAVSAGDLPGPHRDPWDRLLMAQARAENMRLVTQDPVFSSYGVSTLW
jgi:PIN domain nuclease of toxin-antitoxin system